MSVVTWLKGITGVQWLRLAVVLVLIGIVTELVALVQLTPPTFLLFVFIGIPCLLVGIGIYVVYVLGHLKKKDAL